MFDTLIQGFYFVAMLVFLYMTLWYVIALTFKRNDIADVAWGLGFIAVALGLYLRNSAPINSNFFLILILTIFWGLRLAIHIYIRNKGKAEDYRYKAWRDQWGKWFLLRSYLQVFILQGFFMVLISFSAIVANTHPSELGFLTFIGLLLWVVGFTFETFGDLQLARFLKDSSNKGKIMKEGFWKYTRHPNYFGEVTQWWGIFLIALTSAYGYVAVVSPLVISFLILKVSGIPMLEEKYKDNTEFQEYKRVTNAFFPWFPKKL